MRTCIRQRSPPAQRPEEGWGPRGTVPPRATQGQQRTGGENLEGGVGEGRRLGRKVAGGGWENTQKETSQKNEGCGEKQSDQGRSTARVTVIRLV